MPKLFNLLEVIKYSRSFNGFVLLVFSERYAVKFLLLRSFFRRLSVTRNVLNSRLFQYLLTPPRRGSVQSVVKIAKIAAYSQLFSPLWSFFRRMSCFIWKTVQYRVIITMEDE